MRWGWAIVCSVVSGCLFEPPHASSTDADPIDADLLAKDALDPIDAAPIDAEADASQEPGDASIDAAPADADEDATADAEPEDAIPPDTGVETPEIPHLAPEERVAGTDLLELGSQTIDTTAAENPQMGTSRSSFRFARRRRARMAPSTCVDLARSITTRVRRNSKTGGPRRRNRRSPFRKILWASAPCPR